MSGHTPGPWASGFGNGRDIKHSITGPAAADSLVARNAIDAFAVPRRKAVYALVLKAGHSQPAVATVHADSQEEADANARLIAAAPELLEALQAYVNAQDEHDDFAAMKLAEAGIAKATQP